MEKMTDREVLQSIVDAYDFRSELFISDEDCAGNLADRARKQLAISKLGERADFPFAGCSDRPACREAGFCMDSVERCALRA